MERIGRQMMIVGAVITLALLALFVAQGSDGAPFYLGGLAIGVIGGILLIVGQTRARSTQ
jgi:hypothetical protein